MTDVTWLTPGQQSDWIRFAAVLELLPAALDAQLNRDAQLTHFDYFVLAMLSETPGRMPRMTALAARTNATLARLSRVVSRLENEGYLRRQPCPGDRRSTNAVVTDDGFDKVVAISARLLTGLDPDGRMFASG